MEFRTEHHTVGHIIIQLRTGRKTLIPLPHDRTFLVIVTTGNTECSPFTATRHGQIVVVCPSVSRHFVHPICIIIVILVVRFVAQLVIIILFVSLVTSAQSSVKVCLLHHHRIIPSRQQLHPFGLGGTGKFIGIRHTCLPPRTPFRLDQQYAVGSLRTPHGGGGGIFQYGNLLDILHIDAQ